MNIILWAQIIPLIATAVAFGYGVYCFCKKGVAMYFQLLTYGIGCFMLSKLFYVLCLLTMQDLPTPFHVGYLGFMGCFAFLFSANYGQIDSIVDDGGEELKPARMIGFIAPAVLVVLVGLVFLAPIAMIHKLVIAIMYIPAILGSYFNLKHFVAPDFGFLFLKAIRPCNIPILLIYFLGIGGLYFDMTERWTISFVMSIVLSAAFILLIYLAERGRKQWKI